MAQPRIIEHRAYTVANTLNPESDAASMVLQAMEAVEAADCELERGV
jgi:hypothetical protein